MSTSDAKVGAPAPDFAPPPGTVEQPPARRRGGDKRTASIRTLVLCVLFAVLIGASSLLGLRVAMEASHDDDAPSVASGRMLLTLPGGAQCRNIVFDNYSVEVRESETVACESVGRTPAPTRKRSIAIDRDFSWGRH